MASNKDRQRERVKGYFLEAAKDLIRTQGISGLTTKKIGDQAGFSYATIYNYYENLNALLCEAVEALNREVADRIRTAWGTDSSPPTREKLRQRIVKFTALMLDELAGNTHLYYPFLSTEIDFSYFKNRDGHPFVHPSYELVCGEIDGYLEALGMTSREGKMLADILSYVFHAKLHFYIRYQVPETREQLEKELDEEIEFMMAKWRGAY